MMEHLKSQPAKFDFTVQLRNDATPDVVDNPKLEWDEKKYPAQTVAVITIPPQSFYSFEQMRFCENLSYTPWHALPEHRPVGQMNDIRKEVYLASSKLRHDINGTPPTEPTGSEFQPK